MEYIVKFASKILFFAKLNIKHFLFLFTKISPKSYLHKNVAYHSQWESKELVGKILSGEISATNDPKWKLSGAKNKKEYLHWSHNSCGMACFKMVQKKLTNKSTPLVELGKKCLKFGGYKFNRIAYKENKYLDSFPGLFYEPFVKFVKQEYKLSCKMIPVLSIKELIYYLSKNNFIIASVDPSIRNIGGSHPTGRKHLILILGYDLNTQKLIFHNPSGLPNLSQEYVEISISKFKKYFNYRGIILSK